MESIINRVQSFQEELSCVKNVKFPVSYSLHSLPLLPAKTEIGLVSITIMHSGQIRIVHGNTEIFEIIKTTCATDNQDESLEKESLIDDQSVWIYECGSDLFTHRIESICSALKKLIRSGWEIMSTGQFTTTPGYEISTWILKKNKTLLSTAEVTSVSFESSSDKIQVLGYDKFIQVNNAVKQSIEKLIKKEEKKTPSKSLIKDDPECPNVFEELSNTNKSWKEEIILELTHLLFCRQWKLISSIEIIGIGNFLFFCRDSRILPALGQERFAMIQLEKPDLIKLYHLNEETEREVKNTIKENWSHGMNVSDDNTIMHRKVIQLGGEIWITNKESQTKEFILSAQVLLSKILLTMNSKELNIYNVVTLDGHTLHQKNLLIFRQSNISYSSSLILQPRGMNKLAIYGATSDELSEIKEIFNERWPYPLTREFKIEKSEGINSDNWDVMKVKRYPWKVSYGNKHADKLMEVSKLALSRQNFTQVSLPEPQNMDSDSAKSLLLFLIKNLSNSEWRLQLSGDICSTINTPFNHLPERPSDANAIVFLR